MEYKVKGYEPESLFHFFEEICAIPHGSGNEKEISNYIVNFAKERNLEYYQDEHYNVIIKKSASHGSEDKKPVMLQGHMDMVCEKIAGLEHDFTKDPLKLIVKDGVLTADGTTLGADNGIAVALMLAILDDNSIKHPPIECVITTGEEIGLLGAVALDKSKITARTMINLDSEDEGVATVSCAGGFNFTAEKSIVSVEKEGYTLSINISGLLGGHSGLDINKERYNANILMARIVSKLIKETKCEFVSFNGGTKSNAITRECVSKVMYNSKEEAQKGEKLVFDFTSVLYNEVKPYEPEFSIITNIENEKCFVSNTDDAMSFLNAIKLMPNGVRFRNINMGGFVVASTNVAIAEFKKDKCKLIVSARSSVASIQEEMKDILYTICETFGFKGSVYGEYPGWSYAENSPIRELFCESYKELFNTEIKVEAIHAGLECGLFSDSLEGLDAIAVGPDIKACHTPDEYVSLCSVERFYKLLVYVLHKLS